MPALLITYLGGGILLVLLAIPLLFGKIPPNGWYGFRVPATLEQPEIWYTINRYAAKRLILAGAAICAAALGLFFAPGLSIDAYALACLGVFMVTLIPGMVQVFGYLQKITRR